MKRSDKNWLNAILYATENVATILFGIVSIALIARIFGPENLGRYGIAQSISGIFVIFATLGLEHFIVREVSRDPNNKYFISSVFFGMLLGWLLYFILFLLYYFYFLDIGRDLFLVLSIAFSNFFLKVVFVKIYLQASNRPRYIAAGSIVSRSISIAFVVYGGLEDFSFNQIMLYLPIQAVVCFSVMALGAKKIFPLISFQDFSWSCLKKYLKEASPIFISSVLYFGYSQSDILIVSSLLDEKSAGLYTAAIRIIPQVSFIGYALVATFYHQIDYGLKSNKSEFEKYVKLLLSIQYFLGFLGAVIVAIASPLIVQILYGDAYYESANLLMIGCWAWIFMLPAILYSRLLILLGYAKYELYKMILVAPVILAANYFSVLNFGTVGACIVFVAGYALVDFFVYFLFKDTRYIAILGIQAFANLVLHPIITFRSSLDFFRKPAQ